MAYSNRRADGLQYGIVQPGTVNLGEIRRREYANRGSLDIESRKLLESPTVYTVGA
jgi:hypothetical protein